MKQLLNERMGKEEELVAYNVYRGCIRTRHLNTTNIGDINQKDEVTIFTPKITDHETSIEARFFRLQKRKKKSEITHFEDIHPRLIGVNKADTFFDIKMRIYKMLEKSFSSPLSEEEIDQKIQINMFDNIP